MSINEGKYKEVTLKEQPQKSKEMLKNGHWTGIISYGKMKRTVENGVQWKQIATANLQTEDGTWWWWTK